MNIIDKIERNFLLKDLFPDGLSGEVLLGKLELRTDGKIGIHLYTRQKPVKEVNKWGKWGENYNTIVVELVGQFIKKLQISDWQNISYGELEIENNGASFSLILKGNNWEVYISLESLIFQNCSVFIDEIM